MSNTLYRSGMFALYQFAVVAGIALLPIAVVARRVGVALPVQKTIDTLSEAYENARSE